MYESKYNELLFRMRRQFGREYMPIVHEETAWPSLIMNMILRNTKRCLHVPYHVPNVTVCTLLHHTTEVPTGSYPENFSIGFLSSYRRMPE
jgi:hypothetical protein